MWVAQVTLPAKPGEIEEQAANLEKRFPELVFTILIVPGQDPVVLAKWRDAEVEGTVEDELALLRHITTTLVNDRIIGVAMARLDAVINQ